MCDKRGSIGSLAVVIAETSFYKPLVCFVFLCEARKLTMKQRFVIYIAELQMRGLTRLHRFEFTDVFKNVLTLLQVLKMMIIRVEFTL